MTECTNRYSLMQIMTAKTATPQTFYVHIVIIFAIFPQILYNILYARHFLPVKFFLKYQFNKLCFEVPQNVTWTDNAHDQHKYRHKWGKIGLSHLLSENGDLSFLLPFSKQCLVENIKGKPQKNSLATFISEESP